MLEPRTVCFVEMHCIFFFIARTRARGGGSAWGGEASNESTGLGLGLALCAEIVAVSGGELWVESTPGGGGSTFFVRLPVLTSPAEFEAQ